MSALAMFGGTRTVSLTEAQRRTVAWPVVTEAEHAAVRQVLEDGGFTSIGAGASTVRALEADWAAFVRVRHCVAVASGTAAIELALAAAGIEPGAEILVPALSFIASATAAVQRLVIPVFVDIDPVTFTIDPVAAAAAITPRTQAILAVHLHGLPCDMTALRSLAERNGLLLIEDAAQAHGATHQGRQAGSLGRIATFSLNPSKNLPTCGEGGLVTTDDPALGEQVRRYRQFGEDIPERGERKYLSTVLAGNAKMSTIEAAFARCQLSRFPAGQAARTGNVEALLDRLKALPGLLVPSTPEDRTHAWHIIRLRVDPASMGYPDVSAGALRSLVRRALRAEGVPVRDYQSMPLPAQPALREQRGLGGFPWRLSPDEYAYRAEDYPVTVEVIENSLTLQGWHLNPASGAVLQLCADAFEKVWRHLDRLAAIAAQMDHQPVEAPC